MRKWYRRILNATSRATRFVIRKTRNTVGCSRKSIASGSVRLIRETKYGSTIVSLNVSQHVEPDCGAIPNRQNDALPVGSLKTKKHSRPKKKSFFRPNINLTALFGRLSVAVSKTQAIGLDDEKVDDPVAVEWHPPYAYAQPQRSPSNVTFGSMFLFLEDTLSAEPSDISLSMDVTQQNSFISTDDDESHPVNALEKSTISDTLFATSKSSIPNTNSNNESDTSSGTMIVYHT